MELKVWEITEQLKDEITRIGQSIADMKKQKTKDTNAYRMNQYRYKQLRISLEALNNFRMCLPDDFRKEVV